MLSPDTAIPKRSIWSGIDRISLERHTKDLHKVQHVAGPRDYLSSTRASGKEPCDTYTYPFPFEIERQLADDCAFIAAYQPDVKTVSAAAVAFDSNKQELLVHLSANEGISPRVADTMNRVMQTLRQCARRGEQNHRLMCDILMMVQKYLAFDAENSYCTQS